MNCFNCQLIGFNESSVLCRRYGISEEGKDYPGKVMLLWPSDCIKSIPTKNNNNNNNNTHPKATVVKMEGQRNLAPTQLL